MHLLYSHMDYILHAAKHDTTKTDSLQLKACSQLLSQSNLLIVEFNV